MKINHLVSLTILCALLLTGAKCGSVSELQSLLDESKASWERLKDNIDNSYSYTVRWSHPLVANIEETQIIVSNGVVVERRFVRRSTSSYEWSPNRDPFGNAEIIDSWQEKKDTIGTHDRGAASHTLDKLYEICEDEVLKRIPRCNIFDIETFPNGVIKKCTYTKCGYADDLGTGVDIHEIKHESQLALASKKKSKSFKGCPDFYGYHPKKCSQESP